MFDLTLTGKILEVRPPSQKEVQPGSAWLLVEESIFTSAGAGKRNWWVQTTADEFKRRSSLLAVGRYIGIKAFDLEVQMDFNAPAAQPVLICRASKLFIL